jgi:hypothetical protein
MLGGGRKKFPAALGGARLKKSFLRISEGGGGSGSGPGSPGMLGTAPSAEVMVADCLAWDLPQRMFSLRPFKI